MLSLPAALVLFEKSRHRISPSPFLTSYSSLIHYTIKHILSSQTTSHTYSNTSFCNVARRVMQKLKMGRISASILCIAGSKCLTGNKGWHYKHTHIHTCARTYASTHFQVVYFLSYYLISNYLRVKEKHRFANRQRMTPDLKSLPEDLCSGLLRPEKSIHLSRV